MVWPAGTVMVAGTLSAFELLLLNEITAPPAGAGAVSTALIVAVAPERTGDGAM